MLLSADCVNCNSYYLLYKFTNYETPLFPSLGILIDGRTNSFNTVQLAKLAVEQFNRELRTTNTTIIQLQPFIEIVNETSPVSVVDSRKFFC